MEETEVGLMRQIKADDMSGFSRLVEKHQKKVLNFIHKFLGNTSLAEDLTQETFIRVYKARKSYQPTAKFTTWLYHIVKNLCLNQMKKNNHEPCSIDSNTDDAENAHSAYLQSPVNTSIEEAQKTEVIEAVRNAIDSLPPNQKMALILNRYEGLAYDEIAERMEISTKAVKSLLSRARENIKIKLSPYINKEEEI